jgi:hypothetical protein
VSGLSKRPRIIVFTGPTLGVDEAQRELDAEYLPPASQGDVYTAARTHPWGIGIIDGYFERVPAVFHKEILWAMSTGVHVFGCASMGALRAAELAAFGMVGVGEVYEAFARGELTDDDEVTLVHGPAESGYVRGSEAMVNIRATFAAAHEVVSPSTRDRLIQLAKELYYPERTYHRILALGRAAQLPASELDALDAWLPSGRRDVKKADAFEMLRVMSTQADAMPSGKRVDYHFEHTEAWEQVRRQIERRPLAAVPGSDTLQPDALLTELRLKGRQFREQRLMALLRALALELAHRDGMHVGPELLRATADEVRRERGLIHPDAVEAWLNDQSLNPETFARLLQTEARVRVVQRLIDGDAERHLPDLLRLGGVYGRLDQRARHKEDVLARRGLVNPQLADTGLSEEELWKWYFTTRLGIDVPDDVEAYAVAHGFTSVDALRQAVAREHCYVRLAVRSRALA